MLSSLSGLSAGPLAGSYPAPAAGRSISARREATEQPARASDAGRGTAGTGESSVVPKGSEAVSATGLTPEEEQIVAELAATDRQVRAQEQAHLAAAAGLARGVSFTYTAGPDGKQYAVGGEVSIDTSPVSGDPAATIRKAQQIRAAANAPANPSGQDRAVAAQAAQLEAAARQELAEQTRRELQAQNQAAQSGAYGTPQTTPGSGLLLSLIA
jgi:hypothetical protein